MVFVSSLLSTMREQNEDVMVYIGLKNIVRGRWKNPKSKFSKVKVKLKDQKQ